MSRLIKIIFFRLLTSTGALHILNALQANTQIQHIYLDGNSVDYKLLTQIKALAARNNRRATKSSKNAKQPKNLPNQPLQNEQCITCFKESWDCELESSVTSRMTMETIIEESEPEDEGW